MRRVAIAMLGFCLCTATSSAQVEGHFRLLKSQYARQEPIILYFDLTNPGPEPVWVTAADVYSFCSGYLIRVLPQHDDSHCNLGTAGSCLSSAREIKPGQPITDRILLNYENDLSRPGTYHITAKYYPVLHVNGKLDQRQSLAVIEQELDFEIVNRDAPPEQFDPYVSALNSKTDPHRYEAARLLASLAPRTLEDTLLGFADSKEFRQLAPLALRRLNTERSRNALAKLLRDSPPGTYESMESARALADLGDKTYYPNLLTRAKEDPRNLSYIQWAAQLGGEESLPFFAMALAAAENPDSRHAAVVALGYTGSRRAIPILLNVLSSATDREHANFALQMLTRRTTGSLLRDNPSALRDVWMNWWVREGSNAPVYKANECGEMKPL